MKLSAITPPATDPTPIFELYRGNLATELLTAAVAHFNVFGRLAAGPRTPERSAGAGAGRAAGGRPAHGAAGDGAAGRRPARAGST